MAIVLSSSEVQRLERSLHTLLSPLDHASTDDWRRTVNEALKEVLGADYAMFLLPEAGVDALYTEDIDPTVPQAYMTHYGKLDIGAQRRNAHHMEVWTRRQLFADDLDTLLQGEYYNDWCAPNGIRDAIGMVDLAEHGSPGLYLHQRRFGTEAFGNRGTHLLRILLPAFKAGVRIHRRFNKRRRELARLIDDMGECAAVFALNGRLLHRTPQLDDALTFDPARDQVWSEIARLGKQRGSGTSAVGAPPAFISVTTSAASYQLRASALGAGLFDRHPVVLVTLDRTSTDMPSATTLRERFHLTRREAEVALLLAERKSNSEIAGTLGVSSHTARHHTENVLAKLGLRSRTMVREHLLARG